LWRLHSDAGYQTDRDLITGDDLEPWNAADPIVPWGRHKGTRLSEMPDDYVAWGAQEMKKFKRWRKRFKLEMERRDAARAEPVPAG
jgi:hypothetical protein